MAEYQLKTWSYSLWAQAKKCLHAVRLSYIDKVRQPPGPAMLRGDAIHKMAEAYVKGAIKKVPEDLLKFETEFKGLKAANPVAEEFWNFDLELKPTPPYQGQFVSKSDAVVPPRNEPVLYIDYKTGRNWPEWVYQAELGAITSKAKFPRSDGAEVEFWYVDSGDVKGLSFTDSDLKILTRHWIGEGKRLMSERKFLPTPSIESCKWCNHRSDKPGGTCKHWKKVM